MPSNNDDQQQAGRQHTLSHLFLLRLWADFAGEGGEPGVTWGGKVLHVTSGEAHNFRGWPALADLLVSMALKREQEDSDTGTKEE
jgi:hypothetical protein